MTRRRAYTNDDGLRDYGPALNVELQRSTPVWLIVVLSFLVGLICGAHLQAAPVSADPDRCVTLHVRPQTMLLTGDIDVQARVGRHGDHRALRVDWDSDVGMSGSRTLLLEGERAPALFQWWLPHYPPGTYIFDARVYDELGKERGRDRAVIQGVRP